MEEKLVALLRGLKVTELSNEHIDDILSRDVQYFEELGAGYIDELNEAYDKLEGIADIIAGDEHICDEQCIPGSSIIH